jgi:hypothetical protein
MRTIPLLIAKASKLGVKDPMDLLPTVLDDTLCTTFAQWFSSHKTSTLEDALDFLESWLISFTGTSSSEFLSRRWYVSESLEEYIADLETLAAPLNIKISDRAFKLRFIEGLPQEAQPFLRLELSGASWPSVQQLSEKVRQLRCHPNVAVSAVSSSDKKRLSGSEKDPMWETLQNRSSGGGGNRTGNRGGGGNDGKCYNCGGFGHMARVCPSSRNNKNFRQIVGTTHFKAAYSKGPCVPIVLYSIHVAAMIDSGSPVSFLNSDLFQRIQKSLPPNSHYNERRIFSAVNGSSFVSTAVANLYFSVLGQVKCVEFHISESLFGHEIILGRDFLCLGYCLSFSKEGYRLEEQPTINKIEPNPLPPPVIVSPSSITNNCPIENKTPAVENYSTVFNLSGHVGKKMSNLLNKYKDAFAKSSDDIAKPCCILIKLKRRDQR